MSIKYTNYILKEQKIKNKTKTRIKLKKKSTNFNSLI